MECSQLIMMLLMLIVLKINYDVDKIFICKRKDYLEKIINYENNGTLKIKDLDDMKEKLFE